jgi:hypothetical protein
VVKKRIIIGFIVAALVFGAGWVVGGRTNTVDEDVLTIELRERISSLAERNEQLQRDVETGRLVSDELECLNRRSIEGAAELRQINIDLEHTGLALGSSNSRLGIIIIEIAGRIGKVADSMGPNSGAP